MIHDAIVIGGGLAGSAASCLLARQRHSVLLLEKESGPHHKVCGEFISGEAHASLLSLGLNIEEFGARRIRSIRLTSGANTLSNPLPFPAFSLSRHRLDGELINLAIRAGATIQQGVTVQGIQRSGDLWHIATGGENLAAHNVYLATGKHDVRGWKRQDKNADMIGFKMHYYGGRTPSNGEVEIILFPGGYAGIEPIEDGKTNLCLAISKKALTDYGGSWDSLLLSISLCTPRFSEWLGTMTACWTRPKSVAKVPYGFIHRPRKALPGIFRLGDQMAVIPSFAGSGMAIALKTAFMATDCSDSAAYEKSAFELLNRPMLAASLLTSIPHGCLWTLCRSCPSFLHYAARWTRIGRVDKG
jgi:flavin-dependent dehydrogenase